MESCFAIVECRHEFVDMCQGRVGDVFVFEHDSVSESFAFGCFYVTVVDAVVFGGGVKIPSFDGIKCPCSLFVCFFMYLRFTPHWGY